MSLIEKEFKDGDNKYWFFRKTQKNLHNVDTFYFTVTFIEDFSFSFDNSNDNVLSFLHDLDDYKSYYLDNFQSEGNTAVPFRFCGYTDAEMYYSLRSYGGYYNHCISSFDEFDVFIASRVPTRDTAAIVVQIRSKLLWLLGVKAAYDKAAKFVFALCDFYNLHIKEIKENRTDYAWHTNYLQNPEKYLRIDNFAEMQVSHFKRITYQYMFDTNGKYENDYVALGKRGDKCFIRIYLKTKEVVEMGYKPFFINLWFYNELISRYDKYILENLYELHSWKCKDLMRLQFYYDYGSNDVYKNLCFKAMESYFCKGSCNWDYISKLADKLTPKLTVIVNVEFQVMRKMSKSFIIRSLKDNEGLNKRIYDFLDNRQIICDYLLESVLRLVNRKTAFKKSDCQLTSFWESIRRTKMIDVENNKHDLKLHRDYSREHDFNLVKNRYIHDVVNISMYAFGAGYNKDLYESVADTLCLLNDNDVKKAERYREKSASRFNLKDFGGEFDAAFK